MTDEKWATFWLVVAIVSIAATFLFLDSALRRAYAHDRDTEHDGWYMSLKQPDNPAASCCGVADAYWCDDISVEKGKTFCKITDDQDIPMRPKLPMGTKIEIPGWKLKWEQNGKPIGNPTGHSVVFLSSGGSVYCFVQNSGI